MRLLSLIWHAGTVQTASMRQDVKTRTYEYDGSGSGGIFLVLLVFLKQRNLR